LDTALLTQLIIIAAILLELSLRILAVFILPAGQTSFRTNFPSSFFFRSMLFSLIAFNIEKIAFKISDFLSKDLADKIILYPLWLLPSIVYGIYAIIDHQIERRSKVTEVKL